MKKCLMLLFALSLTLGVRADERSSRILEHVAAAFRAMNAYEVEFEVDADGHHTEGGYAVAGDAYYLRLGSAEVFADAAQRYEVDHQRREVTINPLSPASHNILDNPAHVFDYWGDQYTASLIAETATQARILLVPRDAIDPAAERVTLSVDLATYRPLMLEYDYDGDRIVVRITAVSKTANPLPAFDRKAVKDYEMIDFR